MEENFVRSESPTDPLWDYFCYVGSLLFCFALASPFLCLFGRNDQDNQNSYDSQEEGSQERLLEEDSQESFLEQESDSQHDSYVSLGSDASTTSSTSSDSDPENALDPLEDSDAQRN